jgi:hypothetical protein
LQLVATARVLASARVKSLWDFIIRKYFNDQ